MRAVNICPIVALIQFSILSLAIPFDIPSITSRSKCCSNTPAGIVADTLLGRGNHPPHSSRAESNNVEFRVTGTPVSLTFTLSGSISKAIMGSLLTDALDTVQARMAQLGNGLIPGGQFEQQGFGVALRMWNANNHQLTWGVMMLVITGLVEYTINMPSGVAIVFKIWDGANQVGEGQLAVTEN